MTYDIPFNRVTLQGRELEYLNRAIEGGHVSGDGPFTKACERLLQDALGTSRVLLTTSCTHALEMSALLAELEHGDEFLVPSFTFVSTANAFALRGARPVFIDIRADTLNLDESLLERTDSSRVKVVVPVHYAGVGCEMDAIMRWAESRDAMVVEDNAHGLFARHQNRYLGTFGALSTLSFHETKNFTCGEGGALVINDERLIARAEVIREKGTDRASFFRGEVDKYTWRDLGSSFVLSDMLAAFLLAQLERRDEIQSKRERVWQSYRSALGDWAASISARLPDGQGEAGSTAANHLFYVVMPTSDTRDSLLSHLKHQGVLGVTHYVPLHLSEMGQRFGARKGDCPIAEDISSRLLRLPFYTDLDEPSQKRVIDAVLAFG